MWSGLGRGSWGPDRVGEVFLDTLGDQGRRHRRVSRQIASCRGPACRLTSARSWRTVLLWWPGGESGRENEDSQGTGAASAVSGEPPQAGPGVILTPDQRVRVFISSTLGELAEERVAARRAITRLHLVPVWYESGARPHPPPSMYRAYLEQSQVFVGIYWQRYGWVAPGMGISGLEDEHRLAACNHSLFTAHSSYETC